MRQPIPVYRSVWLDQKLPTFKRPRALLAPEVSDVAGAAKFLALLVANVEMDEPQSLSWWADKCNANDVEAVFRALVDANPRLLALEDKRDALTPALYINRCDHFGVATLYLESLK